MEKTGNMVAKQMLGKERHHGQPLLQSRRLRRLIGILGGEKEKETCIGWFTLGGAETVTPIISWCGGGCGSVGAVVFEEAVESG